MEWIPMDILALCILPRLPLKSLLRFKCVSKSWRILISSNDFIQLHNRHSDLFSDKNRVHIFPGDASTLYLHYLDSPLAPLSSCPYPYSLPKQTILSNTFMNRMMTIHASCEFFLLVSRFNSHSNGLILFNPFTRIYRKIPDDIVRSEISSCYPKYGLYLDEAHDDLKVVRVVGSSVFYDDSVWEITIFSLKTHLWTLIKTELMMNPSHHMVCHSLCVNKNLLYTILCYSGGGVWNMRIACFDIRAEQWSNDVPLPGNNLYIDDLCVFDGLLCASGHDMNDKETTSGTYCAWVMKDYSWVKLMTIDYSHTGDRKYRPIAYRKGSTHEILCRYISDNAELFWYNLRDKVVTKVCYKVCPGEPNNIYLTDHICKESLMSFPGGQPQS